MNVVFLSGISRYAGGLFYAVSALSRTLYSKGVDLSVCGPADPCAAKDRSEWNPVPLRPYKAIGPLRTGIGLRKLLSQSGADLVHQHGIWLDDQWAALQWQKKNKKPVVISPHGMLEAWAVKNSAWKKKLVGALFAHESLRRASCIHALCQAEAASIRAYGLNNPIAVIPNGVVLPELREGMIGKRNRKQLVFLGRIHPKKGLQELLEAWSHREGRWHKDWVLMIAGWDDGGYEPRLRAYVNERGMNDSVKFVGAMHGAEKDAFLRGADAFILPSYSEGLPMSVLEAWSYGLPVIMTDHCNLPEGFSAGAAIRISPDVESITAGLMQLAGMERDDLVGMGLKARDLVERNYTWNRIAQDMKTVYEWCLGGDKPACILEP